MAKRNKKDDETAPESSAEISSPEPSPAPAPAPAPKAAGSKDGEFDHEAAVRGANRVSLRGFIAKAGKKADQYAGFAYFATKQKLKARSVVEWDAAYQDFMKRPVG